MSAKQEISSVKVDRISLVSSKHTPAVPLATNDYAIFKMFGGVNIEKTTEEPTKPELSKDIEKMLDASINTLMRW